MKIKHEIELLPWVHKSKKRSNGKAPLFIRVSIGGQNTEVSLNLNITPENWITLTKSASKVEENYKEINFKIQAVKIDLKRRYDELCLKHETIYPIMVKNAYLGKSTIGGHPLDNSLQNKCCTLLKAFDEFIVRFEKLVEKGIRSEETLRHWRTTKRKVASFLHFKYRVADIEFADVPHSFAEDMYDFLTLEVKYPLAEPTAKKHIKNTKQIMKIGVKKQLIPSSPISDFKCGGDVNEVQPLELHQVNSIFNKDFGVERLNEVRDAFIFQCFTGFAYQDIYGLTSENIIEFGLTKEKWLIKDRGKTGVPETVPVLPIVDKLIKKYKHHPKCVANNRLMPIDSNARYNGYLKEIAAICGIERDLNTHLARHTFADIMLNSGVPLEDVSKMLGHKNIRTTQRYCRVRKERISQSMQMAKNKLFSEDGELMLVV